MARWPAVLVIIGLLGGSAANELAAAPQVHPPATPGPSGDHDDTPAAGPFEAVHILEELLPPSGAALTAGDCATRTDDDTSSCTSIEFLIATVPDYVDSDVRWTFDGNIDAVQRAAAAAGYSLYRYWLPDWPPELTGDRRRHEEEPGLAVFTKTETQGGAPRLDVFAVFLVTETPTTGIHERPFLLSAGYVLDWLRAGRQPRIPAKLQVLAPNYSGSSPSLRRALETLLSRYDGLELNVRLISGTATGRENHRLLNFTSATGVDVEFRATVRSDPIMLAALCQHLAEEEGIAAFDKVALLVESNTGYGQGFMSDGPPAPCTLFENATRLPFPLHISRLRDAAANGRRATGAPLQGAVGFDLSHDERVTDQLPSVTPDLTSATVEVTLDNILDTIRREEFRVVGILATDKRDHLFLAERVLRVAPNTLLFSTEADLVYVHPEYRAFTRGALVATTYPLFNATQTLTNASLADQGRQQFASQGAQGIYNAVLAHLHAYSQMLDYAPPGRLDAPGAGAATEAAVIPPVWISVVGQESLWPLDVRPMVDEEDIEYTLPASASKLRGSGPERPRSRSSMLAVSDAEAALVLLLFGVFVVHAVAYVTPFHSGAWTERLRHTPVVRLLHLHQWPDGLRRIGLEHHYFLGVVLLLMWLTTLYLGMLTRIQVTAGDGIGVAGIPVRGDADAWGWAPDPLTFVSILFFLVIGGSATRAMWARRPVTEGADAVFQELRTLITRVHLPMVRGWVLGCVSTVVILVLGLMATLHFLGFVSSSRFWADESKAIIDFARATNPSNWISPVAPVLLLGVVLYVWLVWHLRQVIVGAAGHRSESQLFGLLTGRDPALANHLRDVLISPWRREHAGTLLIPLVALLAYCLYVPAWYTPDGVSFGHFLWWGSCLGIVVVAHVMASTLHLWLLLTRTLRHLRQHPLCAVFSEVAQQPLAWSLSLTPPRLLELKLVTRHTRRLSELFTAIETNAPPAPHATWTGPKRRGSQAADSQETVSDASVRAARVLKTRAGDLERVRSLNGGVAHALLELEVTRDRRRPFLESASWEWLISMSDRLVVVLRHGSWLRSTVDLSEDAQRWYRQAELVVGLQLAFVVRDILSRVVSGMTVAVFGTALILASHLFYSWPGRAAMLTIDWSMLAAGVTGVALMLLRLEKDPILSRLWSRSEGRLTFTGGFFYRIAFYGALPILTLFAWQFPEVGASVFSWLEPLRKAMP